jgi:hypothetical protein
MASESAATATICNFITVFIGGAFCLVVAVLPARRRLLPVAETGCIIPHRRVYPIMTGPAQHIQEKTAVCDDVFQDASSKTHGQPSLTL